MVGFLSLNQMLNQLINKMLLLINQEMQIL